MNALALLLNQGLQARLIFIMSVGTLSSYDWWTCGVFCDNGYSNRVFEPTNI